MSNIKRNILGTIAGFSLIFMKEKNTITDSGLTEMGQGQRQKSLVRHMSGHLIRLFIMTLQVVRSRITVRQQQAEEGFAADYTVYGQSLRLSEGCMPTAVKDGYRFEGWYAWTDAGVVQEKELAELAKQEQYGTLEDELNEKYTEQTKLLENRESERYPASSITLYAKWDKIWE